MTTAARPGQFTGATDNSANGGLFGDTKIDGIPDLVGADVLAAQVAATAAKVSETNAGTSATNSAADAVSTAADRVATAADVVLTKADVVLTKADVVTTGQNVTSIGGSVTAAANSATAAAEDRLLATNAATAANTSAQNALADANLADGHEQAALAAKNSAVTAKGASEAARDLSIAAKNAAVPAAAAAANSKADAQKLAINAANQTFTLSDGSTTGLSALSYAAAAAASATAAAGSNGASGAANSATTSTQQKVLAEAAAVTATKYAVNIQGTPITGSDFSAKAWAVGDGSTSGNGVDHASGRGNAKDWATLTSGKADTSEYSAKEYAIGAQRRGAANGGSAKDWASFVSGTSKVDNVYKSARAYAIDAANSVADFDDIYYGAYASDLLAVQSQTGATPAKQVLVGDLYYNTNENAVKYCQVVPSGGDADGTWGAIVAVNTSGFATKGFATAMAIAL